MKSKIITMKMIKNFEVKLRNDEKSDNTIQKYIRDIKAFAVFANSKDITKALVLEYKAKLEKEYELTSANSMLAAINSFFKFVRWYDCCVKQFKVQRKTYCSEESELTKREYIALVRTADNKKNERLSLLIQTICGTGIRVSELKHLSARILSLTLLCILIQELL